MMVASSVVASVKRVVTCFILTTSPSSTTSSSLSASSSSKTVVLTRDNIRVAVFQRKSTMPTFPSHWAGISGSIEKGEEPWQCAQRELQEETNLRIKNNNSNDDGDNNGNQKTSQPVCQFETMGGLYLDVPFQENRKIRVYPFVVQLLHENTDATTHKDDEEVERLIELKGTEHDTFQFVSIPELENLQPAVPGLAQAFHHATHGKYLAVDAVPDEIWTWASDKVNGASTLAKQAIPLAQKYPHALEYMTTLRPTMVPIVNVLKAMQQLLVEQGQGGGEDQAAESVTRSLDHEVERSIEMGVETLDAFFRAYQQSCNAANSPEKKQSTSSSSRQPSSFTIATFSRSSTIMKILQRFLSKWKAAADNYVSETTTSGNNNAIHIVCGRSTPGAEGELMAQDLAALNMADVKVECIDDKELHQVIREQHINVVVVGADCIVEEQMVINKIGTKRLANTCQGSSVPMLCFTDRWKLWDDVFPPPLEDVFECVPKTLFQRVVLPPLLGLQKHSEKS